MVLDSFGVSQENKLSEQLADDAMKLTTNIVETVKKAGATILSGGEKGDSKGDK